jgi:hypothetical protein
MNDQEINRLSAYINAWLEVEMTDPGMRLLEDTTEHMSATLGITSGSESEGILLNWITEAISSATEAYLEGAR